MEKKTNDLGFLGFEDQLRIVKALIEDKRFFLEVETTLNQNVFTGDNGALLRNAVTIMKDFYSKKGHPLNYQDLEIILKNKAKDEYEVEEATALVQELKSDKYLLGMETAKEIAYKFFKQQETLKVLKKGIEDLAKNGYNEGKTISTIQEALINISKDHSTETGYDLMELFDEVFDRPETEKIPTLIPEIDEAMNGGLSKGMLSLLIAGTGAGKSSMASIICGNAAYEGYKVVQIFFEEKKEEIAAKHYAHFSGEYTKDMYSKENKVKVWNKFKEDPQLVKAFKDNIKLVRMENGTTQVEDIRNMLNKLKTNEGFVPDMVFIDYFSCLQKSSNKMVEYDNECKAGEKAMKKLEQLSSDMNIAIWVAEQTNRNGVKIATANDRIANVQGSFRITQPASFIFYLDRVGMGMNRANLYMDKCRGCEPKEWQNIYLNNGNLEIDLSQVIRNNEDLEYNCPF